MDRSSHHSSRWHVMPAATLVGLCFLYLQVHADTAGRFSPPDLILTASTFHYGWPFRFAEKSHQQAIGWPETCGPFLLSRGLSSQLDWSKLVLNGCVGTLILAGTVVGKKRRPRQHLQFGIKTLLACPVATAVVVLTFRFTGWDRLLEVVALLVVMHYAYFVFVTFSGIRYVGKGARKES